MAADRVERVEDGSSEIVLSGNILGSFTESKRTRDLIVNLQMSCMEPVSREVCAQRFNVMDNYQEQPHLLDPHLGWMLELLLEIIQDKSSLPDFFHMAFKFLLIISKALESKLAACRNFAKDQALRKSCVPGSMNSSSTSRILNSGTKFSHPGHTTFFDTGQHVGALRLLLAISISMFPYVTWLYIYVTKEMTSWPISTIERGGLPQERHITATWNFSPITELRSIGPIKAWRIL